ncbi:MAG: di-trans,poly-cis-decaprenylcistransferase [Planctomycetes bacterium]|nr:di-trans,poly-cis-decaprenylcistransferase [Planctomycetota bacterium]
MRKNDRPDCALPNHIGIIMDGNGRWAKTRGWQRLRGHQAGIESVRDVVEACSEWGIEHLTLYAFSTENWARPRLEVAGLMDFLKTFFKRELSTFIENDVRLLGIGQLEDLPADVLQALRQTEEATADCKSMTLRLALSYGGHQEIASAAKKISQQVAAGNLDAENITPEVIGQYLYHPQMPNPDLIIRTANEHRLSNFLLWQSSYAELYFIDKFWPEFRREDLVDAVLNYAQRLRKFGKVVENG